MSYQVLARKWRPQRFSEVVGQQHILSALENGLRAERLHHAYLFSGTRGVGKTSIARLFAKGLNCEKGITAEPCGECANCKAIEQGRFIDLIEIDAASRTKVEDTRELLDNVQYKPAVGRFKVYLIDEVHMLSKHSFNALLKTLEEPPEYVKFLLATTDPQKLPITILSRCIQFQLRALDMPQIRAHLEFILTQEQIPFEPPALEKLAKAAQGSIRDSLSLTDQAIAVTNANVTLNAVNQMLGLIDDQQPLELVQALALADGEKLMAIIQTVAEKGVDWQQLLSDIAETLHKIALLQLLAESNTQPESHLHFLAGQISPEDVQFFYQVMLSAKKELPFAPEARIGVEMALLRALAFHPKKITLEPQQMTLQAVTNPPHSAKSDNTAQHIQQLRERLGHSRENEEQPIAQQQEMPHAAPQITASAPAPTDEISALLNARHRVKENLAEAEGAVQKKKYEAPLAVERPANHAKKADLQQRFANLAMNVEEGMTKAKKAEAQEKKAVSDEEYRWTWLDPELENQSESAKPSEIKQAILQERTPELVAKTIAISVEKDEWCRITNQLHLGGLSRQVALNSYLAEREGQHLSLVLKTSMAHLNKEDALQSLNDALAAQGYSFDIRLGDSETFHTPLEIRRQIFESLTEAARTALQQDPKLMLLRNTFAAELDESTVRAVAENE